MFSAERQIKMGNVNSKEQEIGFSTEFFPSETGECNIAVHTWRPAAGQSVRGVIQLVHGMSEYVRRFQPIAEYFVSLGYVFCGNDHAGHGDSIQQEDKKGFFAAENGWNALVDDVMTVHRRLKAEYPEAKQILYGHSMGSFIARACASRYGTEFDAFIFSATAGKNPLLPFAKLAARAEIRRRGAQQLSPRLNRLVFGPYVMSVKNRRTAFDWLSKDEAVVDAYIADPLCGFSFRCAAYRDLFEGLDEVSRKTWSDAVPDVPIYVLAGDADPVGNFGRGPRRVCNNLIKSGKTKVFLQIYHGGRHEMHNETERDEVLHGIAAFLRGNLN